MRLTHYFYTILFILALAACKKSKESKIIGGIERLDPALNAIVDEDARPVIIAEGFDWSEGPVWVERYKMLLFSDVPKNMVYKWTEEVGQEPYLTPSGYTGSVVRYGEPGSNGLLLSPDGKLVLCQHGDRRVARMEAWLDDPKPKFVSLAFEYNGKKLSSPNDAVFKSNGDLFFTDPPYGLPKQANDSTKEIPFNGVYKVEPNGHVVTLVDSLTRPNGIAFLPGEKTLIVANSDPAKAIWYAFDLNEKDSVINARIFHDATAEKNNLKGLPDGLKVDKNGNVFASGPGGIWIFNKNGKVLGKIKLTEAASNCALSDDDKILYITNDMYVLRVKMR